PPDRLPRCRRRLQAHRRAPRGCPLGRADVRRRRPVNCVRIGIDVGGTHTDAAALAESNRIVAWTKCPTTADVHGGTEKALAGVSARMGEEWSVSHVLLGTTHGSNAILQREGLFKVATIRLGAPATLSIPPLTSWPKSLRDAISVGERVFPG